MTARTQRELLPTKQTSAAKIGKTQPFSIAISLFPLSTTTGRRTSIEQKHPCPNCEYWLVQKTWSVRATWGLLQALGEALFDHEIGQVLTSPTTLTGAR